MKINKKALVIIIPVIVIFAALLLMKAKKIEEAVLPVEPPDEAAIKAAELIKKGKEFARGGDFNGAKTKYIQALEADPKGVPAYLVLGDLYVVKKDYNTALRYYNEAYAIDPAYPELAFKLGHAYSRNGNLKDGNKFYELAIKSAPENALAYIELAENHDSVKNYPAATELLKKAISVTEDKDLTRYAETLIGSIKEKSQHEK